MTRSNRLLLGVTSLSFAVLIALGTWQVQRLEWKRDAIAKRQHAATANPVTLADIEAGIEHGFDVDWLKVTASGSFKHEHERHVYDLRKGRIGWRIITPFIVPGKYMVLVDRGFVPDDRKDRTTRPQSWLRSYRSIEDTEKISGYVRTNARAAGQFTPKNDVAANRWYSIDLMAMAASLPDDLGFVAPDGYVATLPVLIQFAPTHEAVPGTLPIVDPVDVNLRNNHLQYAITWYSLALVLLVISFLFHRSRNSSRKPQDE